MGLDVVARQSDHLDVALVELRLQLRGTAKLGRANGSVVSRMGEQDAPSEIKDNDQLQIQSRALQIVRRRKVSCTHESPSQS